MPIKNNNLVIAGVSVALIGVVVYVYWSLVYTPVALSIASERKTVQELNQKLASAQSRAGQLNKIQAEMASLQIDVAELEKLLTKNTGTALSASRVHAPCRSQWPPAQLF